MLHAIYTGDIMEQSLLEFRNVTKEFSIGRGLFLSSKRVIRAIDKVSFIVHGEKPTILSLVGESGSGKTTIARIVLGLLKPTSGEVSYKGKEVRLWLRKDEKAYRRNVQAIFQDPYEIYNPFYRIEHVLYMAAKNLCPYSKNEAHKMILESMAAIGLRPEDLIGRYPHQISGGERQRIMLARILLIKPQLVIADEPVSMIDASLRSIFLHNMLDLKEKINMSCLYITHDLNIAQIISDHIIVLCHGRIVETGTRDIVKNPIHPYTQDLVNSIPIPDPQRRWKDTVTFKDLAFKEKRDEQGCIYKSKCPNAMEKCKKETPTLTKVDQEHQIACFQYS